MTLKDDLQEIRGIGPEKADEILAVVDDQNQSLDRTEIQRLIDLIERGSSNVAQGRLESLLED
jgi:hypothetical protein